jgi:hypothetical protein
MPDCVNEFIFNGLIINLKMANLFYSFLTISNRAKTPNFEPDHGLYYHRVLTQIILLPISSACYNRSIN